MELTEDLFKKVCKDIKGYDAIIINESLHDGQNAHRYSYTELAVSLGGARIHRIGYGRSSAGLYYKTDDKYNVLVLTKQEFINKFINKRQSIRKNIRDNYGIHQRNFY